MCCIFGVVFHKDVKKQILNEKINRMASIARYRGPDETEIKIFENAAIGMNRLSIIAPEKHSCIQNKGSVYSVMNGEISNFLELKNVHSVNCHCDSEIVLPLYEKYGKDFVKSLAGMFSISLYDDKNKSITLFRDPLGIKPLYYFHSKEYSVFASEIKIIYSILDEKPRVKLDAIEHILSYRFQPGRESVFQNIKKVLPGEYITLSNDGVLKQQYWGLKDNEYFDSEVNIEEFRDLLTKVVKENSYSDVPAGFFVSGGLDSSLITAMAMKLKDSNYKVPISIKFEPNSVIDEKYGKILEKTINRKFEWVNISDDLARSTLEKLIGFLDEPLENPTHVGTYLMAERAREIGLKSVMTGDGSDEFFLGYERHACWFQNSDAASVYPSLHWTMTPIEKRELFKDEVKCCLTPIVNGNDEPWEPFLNMNQALRYERSERLPEYHNMRLDRMTMANGIEAKVPFLDHRIVEYSLLLSHKTLFGNNRKEWLKQVADLWVPDEIINRKKVLFPSLPNQWLSKKGALWASEILLDKKSKISEFINISTIEKYLKEHRQEIFLRGRLLWALVTLELWLNNLTNWNCK